MRPLLFALGMLACAHLFAQRDFGFIAPEGKILNYRTLNWNDFQEKEDKEFADQMAQQNLQARAYVCPAIYFYADSGKTEPNGRVTFRFRVKCAFQTRSFARESTKKEHSNYVLIHEQDHYDIALTYANKLQALLSSRDYSGSNYSDEIDKITEDLQKKYWATQELYDHEVNPDGTDNKEKQYLWDMRIKKGLENNTDEFYGSTESVVATVKAWGQTVKRIPGEPAAQFAVRVRPMYTEFPQEMAPKIMETTEWTHEPSVIAFYTQKYYIQEDGSLPSDHYRTLAFMYVPNGKDTYKRVLIDTFVNDGHPVSIATAFFANADSDQAKELVIIATSSQRDNQASGTMYFNRVYDNIGKFAPGRLKRLDDVSGKVEGGFEGTLGGKPMKAKFKSQKEILDALKKLGYGQE
jgi:hypothetical protein